MVFINMIASVVFGALYIYELIAYQIHNIEWLLFFMFFVVMAKIENL